MKISGLQLCHQRHRIDKAGTTKMLRENIRGASELFHHTSRGDLANDDNTGQGHECMVGSEDAADSNLHISEVNHQTNIAEVKASNYQIKSERE